MSPPVKTRAGHKNREAQSSRSATKSVDASSAEMRPLAKEQSNTVTNDFITVLDVRKRANKNFTRDQNGQVSKKPGPPISNALGRTINVPDADTMVDLLKMVAENPDQVIMPGGYFPGTEPADRSALATGEEFCVSSMAVLSKHLGISKNCREDLHGWHEIDGQRHIARLKENTLPSCWSIIDRDAVEGMPSHLADMTDEDYIAAMEELIPGLSDVPIVMISSSTGRVLVDGEPMAASGRHYYFQIQDGSDLERFGATLLQRSFLQGYGFMRPVRSRSHPDVIVGQRQWAIFDPSTFSRERIVYEGAPSIRGKGLTLAPPEIEIFE